MKSLFVTLMVLIAFAMTPAVLYAQAQQSTAEPSLSQPLVREGTFATKLAENLKVGNPTTEAEAESVLNSAGIAPRNGWIADYPVTPDIVGELQASVSEAADAGKITMSKDAALKAFQDTAAGYNLYVTAGGSDLDKGETSAPNYADPEGMNNYYSDEGPPVVTYYEPPPDYAYMYTWVPYPFWWTDFWFPGFFVLVDFDVRVHRHHGHGHEHERGHGHDEFISNHFRDSRTGRMSRIDPVERFHGRTVAGRAGEGWSSPAARRGAGAIFNAGRNSSFSAGGIGSAPLQNRTFAAPSGSSSVAPSVGGTCSSCHSAGRSPGFSGGRSSSGGSRGSFGGASRGSFGGGWRR